MPNKKEKKKENNKNIEETLKDIKSKFGDESIMTLNETRKVNVDSIPSGSIGLDVALGVQGYPRGRVIEIFGPESSGKTTIALHAVAEAQKKGGICAFVDAEHAMDPDYAKKIGVKTDQLLISQPDTGEQALEIVESLVRSGKLDVIVIDSVAALTPKDEIEGEMGAHHVGKQARLMSQALRKLTAIVAKSKTVVIFINQIRMKIGVMFGCFSYDTEVMLADGTREKIGKIVNQELPVEVLSYNFETKKIEAKPVIDWHANGETDAFLQFFVSNHTGNGRRGFSCTPDHKIFTPAGWKKAKDLKEGDEISVRTTDTELSTEQEEIIIGSLLGDGNIKMQGEQTAYFREEHGAKQSSYVAWLGEELGDVTRSVNTKTSRGTAVMETKALLRIGDLRTLFYPQNKKIVPESIVQTITPRAIALWYCGDGSMQTGTSEWKGKTYARKARATLYTNGFTDTESKNRIMKIFERFDISPTWRKHQDTQALSFSVKESEKFFELIAPFVPSSMEYKLPADYRGKHHASDTGKSNLVESLRPMRIRKIQNRIPYKDGQRISKQRFDITVADNHNFFVDDCLVSNSPETTPGGKALKFYTSVRLDVRRIAQIKKGDEVMGGRVRVKVVKNKVAAPFKQTEFDLMYNEGISHEGEILALGEKFDIIDKSNGAIYTFGDEKLGRGYDATRQYLKENKKVANEILKQAKKKLIEE